MLTLQCYIVQNQGRSVVKILSKDKDSKLPNNRRGRIVQLDEQTNSASVVLADGEIVEGMALDQLDLEYEERYFRSN